MIFRRAITALVLAATSISSAYANWTLDNSESALHFLTTKNGQVTEVHRFDTLTGSLSTEGKLEISVSLASVNTAIDIRNTRMQEMLFEVANFATARFSTTLPQSVITMTAGESMMTTVKGIIDLHGKSVPTDFSLQISKLNDGSFIATTVSPTLLSAAAFNLEGGVEALQTIAGLKSITATVPVTFSVTFKS